MHGNTRGGPGDPRPSPTQPEIFQVGAMLALFSLLGAFFSLLDASYALFGHFWPILDVFFGFLVALDSILQALGQVLEPSNLHFSICWGVSQHKSQKCSSCNKTMVFAMFYRLWNMSRTATERVFCIAFRAWLDMVHGLLQKIPAGIHWLLFKTLLQRGGTCAAHPPPPEGMPSVPNISYKCLT